MIKLITPFILVLFSSFATGQSISIAGTLLDDTAAPVAYANIVLYQNDETMLKVSTTDDKGDFTFQNIASGTYKLVASYIGLDELIIPEVSVEKDITTELGELSMSSSAIELETAVVSAQRAMVEIKPDRTVFNVQGTINSTGDNGLGLLRKAPGVLVDNNNNITVLGRSGVLVYIDGKRLPLSGEDLTAYLENLQADQIDRMDIITNPGAKYEAEGNAGIIDIRLKKDKSHGSNGSLGTVLTQGQEFRSNINASGNYRNKLLNAFGSVGYSKGKSFHQIDFVNHQNQLILTETNRFNNDSKGYNIRLGTDFFIGKNHTIGFLVGSNINDSDNNSLSVNEITKADNPTNIDSILIADNTSVKDRNQSTYNVNYQFNNGKSTVNMDLDYGRFTNMSESQQPNSYYDASGENLLSKNVTKYETPSTIDIYTAKLDYETETLGGRLGLGAKFSQVNTDNTFLFFNVIDNQDQMNDKRSNKFAYDEQVEAAYASFAGAVNQKVNYSLGLRVEHTDARGDLTAFDSELNEDPVTSNYFSYFPSAGITYSPNRSNVWSLNYGRRINRPDYNVLNPFEEQISELSFSKGNPFLDPEIVNNLELGYTYAYMYNFKLAYSRTTDQITRLIGPDDRDPRAGFINWDNLAEQTVVSFNASAPVQINNWWSLFANFSASYLDNQADYGENGGIIDLQAFTYNIFQQSTFTLGGGYTGEISGWFSGPGVWGGVFLYETSYSLNLGLQKKFFNDNLKVKLSAQDITYQTGWSGYSEFDGLFGEGMGSWDSRFVSLSLSYAFGNNNVKSRKRKTGIEEESKRVSSGR